MEALHGSHVFCLSSHVIFNLNLKYTLLKFHILQIFDHVIWSLVVNSIIQNTLRFILFWIFVLCNRIHPERKQIDVRSLNRITYYALEADLIGVNIDRECTDVNIVVRQYDASLSSLLDKHAPSKRILYVVDRPMNDWMTDDILVLKALRRKYESLWRKTRVTVHFDMYSESCMAVKKQE